MAKRTRKELAVMLQAALQGQDISRMMNDEHVNDVFEITMDLTGDGKRRIDGNEVSVEEYQKWVMDQKMIAMKTGNKFYDITLNL